MRTATRSALLFAVAAGLAFGACVAPPTGGDPFTAHLGSALRDPIIVDDQHGAPTFTITGDDWTTWGTNGHGYSGEDTEYHYLSHTVGGSDRRGTATWTPDIPQEGTYRIEAWYRLTGNRTQDADHFVLDGYGNETHIVLDQYGDGPSGWVSLGEYWCTAGTGGCSVTLDGTDDDESDEANAMQFTLVDTEPPPPPEDCDEFLGLGQHTIEWYATSATASGWSDPSAATGPEDGVEAHSENVDEGESLDAGGWEVCDPIGEETLDSVEVEVLSRMQYDSGQYQLILAIDGGGDAYTTYSHVASAWDTVDITTDRDEWTWVDVEHVVASVTLYDHPGGARDSDAWADAFRIRITYTTTGGPGDDDAGDDDAADDDAGDDDLGGDDDTDGSPQAADDDGGWESGCGCRSGGDRGASACWVLVVAAVGVAGWRRRGCRVRRYAP